MLSSLRQMWDFIWGNDPKKPPVEKTPLLKRDETKESKMEGIMPYATRVERIRKIGTVLNENTTMLSRELKGETREDVRREIEGELNWSLLFEGFVNTVKAINEQLDLLKNGRRS
jgi:hypothetical protein